MSAARTTGTTALLLKVGADPPGQEVRIKDDETVTQLRRCVVELTGISLDRLTLTCGGHVMEDDDASSVVAKYQLMDQTVLLYADKEENDTATGTTAPTSTAAATATPRADVATGATTGRPDAAAVAAQDDIIARFPIRHNDNWEVLHATSLLDALQLLNSRNLSGVFNMGVTTLRKIVQNIFDHPLVEKYRCLKVHNPIVQQRLLSVAGGRAALLSLGFSVEQIDGQPQYYLEASIGNRGKILAAHMQLTVIGLHPCWTTSALVDMARNHKALMGGGSVEREPLVRLLLILA